MNTRNRRWKRWALSALILPAPAFGQLQSSDIFGYWALDGDLVDGSGNGGDGTFQTDGAPGTPTFTNAAQSAQFGEAISLVALNDQHVTIDGGGNAGFQGEDAYDFAGGSMSLSAWFSTTAGFTSAWQALIAKGEGESWRVGRNREDNFLNFASGLGNVGAASTSDVGTGLHHFVVVSDASKGNSIYIDGVLQGFVPGAPVIGNSPEFMTIGNNPEAADRAFDGTFDDVILFNRALTGPEATLIYNGGTGIQGSDILSGTDSDGDGMPDFYELANGLDNTLDDTLDDKDIDNINNITEYQNGTGANDDDSDDDGLKDGDELANNALPLVKDTDGDGLSDGDEVNIHMTEPDDTDSDDDQASDFDEITAGSDPNNNTSVPSSWKIGLTSYWKFDNDLTDSGNLGADGTYRTTDMMPETYSSGKFGNAIDLSSAQNEYVEIVGTADIPEDNFDFAGSSMSVSAWITTGSGFTSNWQALIAKGEGTSWRLSRRNASDSMAAVPGNWKEGTDDLVGGLVNDGEFHHIAMVVDSSEGGTGQLWVDGMPVSETNAPPVITGSTLNLLIGGNPGADPVRSWNGLIDDVAIWNRPLNASEIGQIWAASEGRSIDSLINDPDTDGDGMPDSYETANMLNRLVNDAEEDADMDNVSNFQEFLDATLPQVKDTDMDGLDDGEEKTAMTDPLDQDSDNDTLLDGDEVDNRGTNPALADTDSDGFSDIVEIDFNTLPADETSFPSLDTGLLGYWPLDVDLEDDTDGNGNGTWYENGTPGGDPVFATGKYGAAISLDHSMNQYVLVDGAGGATPRDYTQAGDSVSISVWTSFTTFSQNWQGLVARGEGTAWRLAGRGPDSGDGGQLPFAAGGQEITTGPSYNDGQFHHIVAVAEKGMNVRIYVDGALVVSSSSAPVLTDNGNPDGFIVIGGNPNALLRSWDGIVDDVAIWGRPLSDDEIAALAAAPTSLGEQLGLGGPSAGVRVIEVGFNNDNQFLVSADNLNPNIRYVLRRSTTLVPDSFVPVGQVVTGEDEGLFTDPNPPSGKAFYQVWTAAPEAPQ